MKRTGLLPALLLAALSALSTMTGAADAPAAGHHADAAAESPAQVVEARRAGFKKMGSAMRFINDQLKTPEPDLARMGNAAADLVGLSAKVVHWFPAGTGAANGFDTDALDYIWKQREKFDELAARFGKEAAVLAASLSGGDVAAVRTQARGVGAVCSDCHRSFRAD